MSDDIKRHEPERTCERCGYVLDYLTTNRCPECGFAFDPTKPPPRRDAETVRTQRLMPGAVYGVCLIAIGLVFGVFAVVSERAQSGMFIRPTFVLFAALGTALGYLAEIVVFLACVVSLLVGVDPRNRGAVVNALIISAATLIVPAIAAISASAAGCRLW